jgi:hypothetical protein
LAREKKIEPDQPIEVLFTPRERDLILEHTFADGELTDRLRVVEVKGAKFMAKYTLDDLDVLLGYIAAEANHTPNKKLQKELDALFARLQHEIQSYDDGQWPQPL